MQCPLCGGPLHIENPETFRCERGHELHGVALAENAATRVIVAFWLAIEALESEAEALRLLGAEHGGDPDLAAQASDDALLLRKMAGAHLAPVSDGEHD